MLIKVKDASVKTVAVEIRTLTISNKQVTLALFRQIKEESVLDWDTGGLCGIPWGTVNYHVGCDDDAYSGHIHVVWQKGDELRRDVVNPLQHLEWYLRELSEKQSKELRAIFPLLKKNINALFELPQLFIAA